MSNLRQRSIFGGLVVVLGALLFLMSSAYVVDRGYNKILAAIVGGLAFPVLPVAWQLWAERARKKKQAEAKKPSKSTLTAYDRFWIRFVVVAGVILGPMIYVGKIEVPRAAIRHATWFLPEFEPGLGMIGNGPKRDLTRVKPLLERVPADAEVVITWEPPARGAGVMAFNARDLVAAADGDIRRDDDTIRSINDYWKAQHFFMLDPIAMVIDRDLTVAASDKWKGKVEPAPNSMSSVLRAGLEHAPADAILTIALAPHAIKELKILRDGALWVAKDPHGDLVLEGRLVAGDVAKAYQIVETLRHLKAEQFSMPASCRDKANALFPKIEVAQVGDVVTLRMPFDLDVFACN